MKWYPLGHYDDYDLEPEDGPHGFNVWNPHRDRSDFYTETEEVESDTELNPPTEIQPASEPTLPPAARR